METGWTKARRLAAKRREDALRTALDGVMRDFAGAARLLNRLHPTCWQDECDVCGLIGRSGHEFSEPKGE